MKIGKSSSRILALLKMVLSKQVMKFPTVLCGTGGSKKDNTMYTKTQEIGNQKHRRQM